MLICCKILTPLDPKKDVISPRAPGTFLLTMVNRAPEEFTCGAKIVVGKLTEFRIVPVSKKSIKVSAAIAAELSSASSVEAPKCGKTIKCGSSRNASSVKSEMYLPVNIFES